MDTSLIHFAVLISDLKSPHISILCSTLPLYPGMEAFDTAVSFWEDAADIRVVQDIEEEDSRDEDGRVSIDWSIYTRRSGYCPIVVSLGLP